MSDIERGRRVLEIEAEAIRGLIDRLDERFEQAVELLLATSGKVVVAGLGKSGIICRKIAATLASTGTPAFFLHAAEGLHGDLGMVIRGDAAIVLSNSGETREVVAILPLFKRLAVPVIALTSAPESTLGRAADVVLDVAVSREACPLALAPTASTTAALAMGDALAVALMERRGFREEDFAELHPAGSLGRRLLRVEEVMHAGEQMPVVRDDTPLADAIAVMTERRLGHTGVVDASGLLVGVISDGDLRRALSLGGDVLARPAGEVMSPSPRTVEAKALGAKAVAMMEEGSITALFIVDDAGRPRGILHLHDLLKAGVV